VSIAALPAVPTVDEAAHSARLVERMRVAIDEAGGKIGFARFMEMALYEPGFGYYSAGARKLGAAGDFITAPEVAPLFSRCVAAQSAEVLRSLGGGDVLELGAGSGAMAAAMLAELEALQSLPARYLILDISADLRQRQRETLAGAVPHLLERVCWLDRLPDSLVGVVVANEVLDAMPVERFVVRGGSLLALDVAWRSGRFEWVESPAAAGLRDQIERIRAEAGAQWPDGYCSELNAGLEPWLSSVADSLERGVALFIDYGLPRRELYAAERSAGTLLCHFRHRFHDDPLVNVGLQDITAWVDFTAVAEAGERAGLEVAGYTTQAHFLIGNDLAQRVGAEPQTDLVQRVNLSRQAMLLTLPGEMGERFRAIALTKGYDSPLRGFAVRNLMHTL
jgi:SAM-dependent MidA family methyltransferase